MSLLPPQDPAPMTTQAEAPGDAELRALFSGKRTSERHSCHFAAQLDGARGAAACTVLDLSTTGALVQIDDPDFVAADRARSMTTYMEMLQVHAKDGVALRFPAQERSVQASVVRFTTGAAGSDATRVGLHFSSPIDASDVEALRSGAALPGSAPRLAAPRVTHVPKRGVRLTGLVHLALKPGVGPVALGVPTQLGSEHVTLSIDTLLAEGELRARLGAGALYLGLQEGALGLHETTARLGALVPKEHGGYALTLLCKGDWPPSLKRRLKRA